MEVKIKQMEELSLQSCIKLFVWDRINFHCWKKNLLVTQSYYAFKVIEDFYFFFMLVVVVKNKYRQRQDLVSCCGDLHCLV